MQRGAAWLGQQLQANATRTVQIEQGTQTLTSIVAWCCKQEYEVIDDQGFLTTHLCHDWNFVAADLGSLVLRAGAEVTEVVNGVTVKYEAMGIGKKPAVEMLDTSGILLTLHTKRVANG